MKGIEMDRAIVQYDIVTGQDVKDLVQRMTESMKKGWVPQGGVTLTHNGHPMQAVVKYASPNQLSMANSSDYP